LPHITATTTNSSLTNFVGDQPHRFYRLRTLAQNPTLATVTLSNLNQPYSGTGRPASAITAPAGLNVSITYNGRASAPTNAGTYEVIAAIVEPDFVAGTTNTLVVLAPPPIVLSIAKLNSTDLIPPINSVNSANVLVSWNSVSNLTYRLQYKDSLAEVGWNDVTPDIQAVGPTTTSTNAVPVNQGQRFYRVRLVP
jgi:hypothetical protein